MESFKINEKALRHALKRRGLSHTEASEGIGRANNYISYILKTENMNPPTAKSLEAIFGISPEEYKADSTPHGTFDVDQAVEELKALNGAFKTNNETLSDISYVLNVIARDLAEIKYSLGIGEKEE